mmetsp:Transcript_19769/g.30039  ORF Transcript_19769/g.30039 Transcript_19769/m.30039 type:complete len:190 (+) Transcript_19769:98-667(+)
MDALVYSKLLQLKLQPKPWIPKQLLNYSVVWQRNTSCWMPAPECVAIQDAKIANLGTQMAAIEWQIKARVDQSGYQRMNTEILRQAAKSMQQNGAQKFSRRRKKVVTKQEFVEALGSMPFVPPLASGAPYLSASAAKKIDDIEIVESLFDVLVQEKDVLTEKGMSRRMKEISEGEEGLTWPLFSKALGL